MVQSQEGYFLSRQDSQSMRLDVSQCPNEGACPGGTVDGIDNEQPPSGDTGGLAFNKTQCDGGYQGPLCAECQPGWYSPRSDPLTCYTCPSTALAVVYATVKTLGVILLGAYSAAGREDIAQASRSEVSSLLKMAMVA